MIATDGLQTSKPRISGYAATRKSERVSQSQFERCYVLFIKLTMKVKQKPLALVCYLCGRQFGTQSLKIHLKSCKSKIELAQSKQGRVSQAKLPQEPALLQQILGGRLEAVHEYNQFAYNFHKYQVLPACPYCHRTFNEDSFEVHQRVCPKKPKQLPFKSEPQTNAQMSRIPRILVCCVCGREFGVASLKIHYPQCCEKFKVQQSHKEKEQRRVAAKFDASQLEQITRKEEWSVEQLKRFNEKATLKFEEHSKIHCQGCKRRFMPQAYNHHLKHCQLHSPSFQQSHTSADSNTQLMPKMPRVLVCCICGQQFGLASLSIHQKACKMKFLRNEEQKPAATRKNLPSISPQLLKSFDFKTITEWNQAQIEKYNAIASEVYRTQSMQKCAHCQRTFTEQAYEKHLAYCNRQKDKEQLDSVPRNYHSTSKPIGKRQLHSLPNQKSSQRCSNQVPSVAAKQQELQNKQSQPIIEQSSIQDSDQQANELQKRQTNEQLVNISQPLLADLTANKLEEIKKQTTADEKQSAPQLSSATQKQQPQTTIQLSNHADHNHKNETDQFQFKEPDIIKEIDQQLNTKSDHLEHQNNQKKQQQQIEQVNPQKDNLASNQPNRALAPNPSPPKEIEEIELTKCSKCGRKFLLQRLIKHESICKGIQKFVVSSQNIINKKEGPEARPLPQISIEKKTNTKLSSFGVQNHKGKSEHKNEKSNEKENNRIILDTRLDTKDQNKGRLNNIQTGIAPTKLKQQEPFNQFMEEAALELVRCKKCNRNFRADRVDIHQRVCIGQASKKKLQPPIARPHVGLKGQKEKQEDKRETRILPTADTAKHNIMNMLKEIKSRKVKESEIDEQLNLELNTLQKGIGSARVRDSSFGQAQNRMIELQVKKEETVQHYEVGKWKKKRTLKIVQN